MLKFAGTVDARAHLRDKRSLRGRLPELVHATERLLYEHMRREAVVRGLIREEVPEYPPPAVREALLNAVAHRDYSLEGAAVQVRLYDDALEIESPGRLPAHVRIANLRDAQFSRNPLIMDAFHDLHLVEEAGTGIDRIYDELADALLTEPEFEEPGESFCVRFRNTGVFAADDRLWILRFAEYGLSPHEKIALVYARRHRAVANADLRRLRQLHGEESRRILQRLVGRELLEGAGAGRGARYVLGPAAIATRGPSSDGEQLDVIVAHAERVGSVVNADVRGLLSLDRAEALRLLRLAVDRGRLTPTGERRGRRYLPAREPFIPGPSA